LLPSKRLDHIFPPFSTKSKKDESTRQRKIFCTLFSEALEANPKRSKSKVANSVDEKSDVLNVKELAFGSLQK